MTIQRNSRICLVFIQSCFLLYNLVTAPPRRVIAEVVSEASVYFGYQWWKYGGIDDTLKGCQYFVSLI
jgi:hypothetical protein